MAPTMSTWCLILCMVIVLPNGFVYGVNNDVLPVVINTWPFTDATAKAWDTISSGGSALDAVEKGCTVCEVEQCDGTVGYGGSPDSTGETTLDAMIMDGTSMDVGSVGCLRNIRSAISVARVVMEATRETLLVGTAATNFAVEMGFQEQPLETEHSRAIFAEWKKNNCSPNYWVEGAVMPDPTKQCGPYKRVPPQQDNEYVASNQLDDSNPNVDIHHHDTIGMVVVNASNHVMCGTTTNGANHKIAGRVGDSPITGSGSYCDSEVGGAAQTGDGDVMMRFSPTYQTVENMRHGMTPQAAAEDAIRRIMRKYPTFAGGIVAVNREGEYGAASHSFNLTYSVRNKKLGKVTVFKTHAL
ncbi:N(4)-(Beta-N-acetylglucosaminyl)-L-asparaginase-like [Sycon ciliatum]|uniref:N(4)-(Beta-N-acetylglucosaminyl)-L-asparaginase- like n=1 Tax=Sycon ciliatum TaxID=27933 RepID=UPI0031F65550|eukprot:scpid18198/ scgid31061/ N(4)-(Beta-N-acetylglucosaminyl)-L-asparaginase; Aspartylglucosaminidase; Glycosylasparaginase; N4-(N-acetyl-beta-glucosaminyl)-L-asparagine amidase; Glycosylasparaginase alpha chain; Glycosylasparaginase beta chain